MKIMYLLSRLFSGSVRVSKEMKPSATEGGNFVEAKSVKKNEIPQRGQFNIMVSYGNEKTLPYENIFKNILLGIKSPEFPLFLTNLLIWSPIIQSTLATMLLSVLYFHFLIPKPKILTR